jgi:hypothetical protein
MFLNLGFYGLWDFTVFGKRFGFGWECLQLGFESGFTKFLGLL